MFTDVKSVIFYYRDKLQTTVSKYEVNLTVMHAFRSYDYLVEYNKHLALARTSALFAGY